MTSLARSRPDRAPPGSSPACGYRFTLPLRHFPGWGGVTRFGGPWAGLRLRWRHGFARLLGAPGLAGANSSRRRHVTGRKTPRSESGRWESVRGGRAALQLAPARAQPLCDAHHGPNAGRRVPDTVLGHLQDIVVDFGLLPSASQAFGNHAKRSPRRRGRPDPSTTSLANSPGPKRPVGAFGTKSNARGPRSTSCGRVWGGEQISGRSAVGIIGEALWPRVLRFARPGNAKAHAGTHTPKDCDLGRSRLAQSLLEAAARRSRAQHRAEESLGCWPPHMWEPHVVVAASQEKLSINIGRAIGVL